MNTTQSQKEPTKESKAKAKMMVQFLEKRYQIELTQHGKLSEPIRKYELIRRNYTEEIKTELGIMGMSQ